MRISYWSSDGCSADLQDKLRIAVIAVDPTRRRGGGALLGDRIRMNSVHNGGAESPILFRSLATRGSHELPDGLEDVLTVVKAAGHDLVVLETPRIGPGYAGYLPFVATSIYVLPPEFRPASPPQNTE